LGEFLRFFGKTTPYGENFQNSISKGFTASPIDVLFSNFVKIGRRESGKVVRYLPDKKKLAWLSGLSLLRGSRSKAAWGTPRQCTHAAPDFIQIGSLSAVAEL